MEEIRIYHVKGVKRGETLYGTFSTFEKAIAYMKELEKSPTADYVYSFVIEDAKLDPKF